MEKIQELSKDIDAELKDSGLLYRTISIIAIDTRLQMQTRSRTTIESASLSKNLDIAQDLLRKFLDEDSEKMLRRIGIRVSGFSKKKQKSLGEFAKP
jgi:cytidylate kinase